MAENKNTELIKVEVGQYRLHKKEGPLRAFFSLVVYPHGIKYLDCRYFVTADNRRWFTFPQKEIKPKTEGAKAEWIPLVSIIDRDYSEKLKLSVLAALKTMDETARADNESSTQKTSENALQQQASTDWLGNL